MYFWVVHSIWFQPTDEEESDFSIDSNEEYDESDFETEENQGLVMMKDKVLVLLLVQFYD